MIIFNLLRSKKVKNLKGKSYIAITQIVMLCSSYIFRGIWYSNVNRECFGDFCMTINHLDCSKGSTSLLRLLNGDDQWKSWSQQNRNLLGILSSGEQDDNPPQRITINILIHIQVQRRNRGEIYCEYCWNCSAQYT